MARLLSLLGVIVLLSLAAAPAAQAQVNEADRAAIRQVIEAQLAAFQHDDGPGAYAFASPTIQQKFVNPDIFLQMVRSGYPAVYRPQEVEFRELGMENGLLLQHVYLVGPDGRPVMAVYEMQRQPDGSWRINGCWLTQIPGESV
jgi:hypothetical protein